MLTVYGMAISGNCYKVKLLLEQLDQPYRWVEIDTTKGETRSEAFLAKNPNGKVPIIQLEDGSYLSESNAILWYLAEGSPLAPSDRMERARMLQWMFFEQYEHEPTIAVARAIMLLLPPDSPRRAELPKLRERGYRALDVMEACVARQPWFGGEHYSIADITLFAYTHNAGEGGFDLYRYPTLRNWISRIKAQPRFVPMARQN
jgi:glutathione S-transferase